MASSSMAPESVATDSADNDWVDVNLTIRSKPSSTDRKTSYFYSRLNEAAAERLRSNPTPIFWVDFDTDLYDTFTQALPESYRQEYNCTACHHFMKRQGQLALVKDNGELLPLMWDPKDNKYDAFFREAVKAVAEKFAGRKVTKVFKVYPTRQTCGFKEKGGFNHMFITFPDDRISKQEPKGFSSTSTSELAEMLKKVMKEYDVDTVKQTTLMLEQHKLRHADNHKAAARWLLNIMQGDKIRGAAQGQSERRWNLRYRYAASSFTGCINQLRSGALATLLDNVKAGLPFNTIQQEWIKTVDPTKYLRPQAAPTVGNIAASERLFTELGLTEEDTRRRFLVLADVPNEARLWQRQKEKARTGIFANVVPKESKKAVTASSADLPPTKVSVTKFITKVLAKAAKVEYKLATHNGVYFFITGFEGTKPLMQWHNDSNRASWYIYQKPAPVESHYLKKNGWNQVTALIAFPHLWDGAPLTTTFPLADEDSEQGKDYKYYHKAKGFRYLFVLDNIKDDSDSSLSLFPTLLKSEFHGARATIESYSNKGKKQYVEDAEAKGGYVGGIEISRGKSDMKHLVRVTDQKGEQGVYELVAWD